jgi:hypothetical protein
MDLQSGHNESSAVMLKGIVRMLLSHNFDISSDILPELSREEFTKIFEDGFKDFKELQCRMIVHPHWITEVLFPIADFSPEQVGRICAQAMTTQRQPLNKEIIPEILVLGGMKTTPPTSNSPDALQPQEWGVDVVETLSGATFLQAISWDATVASKPSDQIFKVEL